MRKYCFLALLLALVLPWKSQSQSIDTTIYEVAESLPIPLLANCMPERHPGWTEDSVRRCAESQLLAIVSKNIRYPEEARQNNLEGTVVTSFVVEQNGRISSIKILKDIGGGCGPEAARVLEALDEAGLRWRPALREGKPVRMRQALPLRFRLQEALPYYINSNGDSIYVQVDSMPNFQGGEQGLLNYILKGLNYPTAYRDSCKTGIIEMALVIKPDGQIVIEEMLDFNALGLDFQWEAIRMANRSSGMWIAAQYQGRQVATSVPVRALFKSEQERCKAANAAFDKAMILGDEGAQLAEQNKAPEALEKWNAALALNPDNGELLYYRGSTLLALDRLDEACADFNKAKALMGTIWFEPLRKLVCGQ